MIRTGSTSERLSGAYVGQLDCPLCDKGRDGLLELKNTYEYPRADIVFTSPLVRCTETAEILYPDTYTRVSDGFADLCLGEFEGKTSKELSESPAFGAWLENSLENLPPGGEPLPGFTARIIRALGDAFTFMMDGRIRNAAIITHAGVIMTLLAVTGLPKRPPHEWLVPNGYGHTLLMTPQMWMRDGFCEVFSRIPHPMHDMSDIEQI